MSTNQGPFGKIDPFDFTSTDSGKIAAMMKQAQTSEPFAAHLADAVGRLKVATNFGWTLNTGYLVLFMQAGFALLTCGLVRKKNAAHLMMLNFAAYVVAFIGYYICGLPSSLERPGFLTEFKCPATWAAPPL